LVVTFPAANDNVKPAAGIGGRRISILLDDFVVLRKKKTIL